MNNMTTTGAALEAKAPEERDIEIITGEILFFKAQAGGAIIEIGRRLNEAKEQLDHGQWLDWLRERVEFSEVTAQRAMRLAREYPNPSPVTDLGVSKALALLALPVSEREEFISVPHQVNGQEKTVQEMSRRELDRVLQERDEARQAAESAKADAKTAEESRAKMEADMKMLQSELKELKARPVEVAVEVDEKAVEAARKAAVDEMTAQVDQAKAAHDKAEEKRKAAEAALADANARLAEAAKAEKKAVIGSDRDLAAFELLFGQAQEIANKLHGLLLKARGREDTSQAAGMQKALRALAELIGKAAEV